jgi:hypothetical protein
MALPGKEHAVFNAKCGENSPAGKETYLSGRKGEIRGELDLVVVEDVGVKHKTILQRGNEMTSGFGRSTVGRGEQVHPRCKPGTDTNVHAARRNRTPEM